PCSRNSASRAFHFSSTSALAFVAGWALTSPALRPISWPAAEKATRERIADTSIDRGTIRKIRNHLRMALSPWFEKDESCDYNLRQTIESELQRDELRVKSKLILRESRLLDYREILKSQLVVAQSSTD